MKKIYLTTMLMLVFAFGHAQEPSDSYDFSYPKIKFSPLQPASPGLTFKLTHTEKTDRLTQKNLEALYPLIDLDMKWNRKTPDVTFFYNVGGITVVSQKTITENSRYFKLITYTLKNNIECIGKDGNVFNKVVMEDGNNTKTVKVGSNFFRQLKLDNDKYPKPAEIANIDAAYGYVPSFEESFHKPEPVGFGSAAELDIFMDKYNNLILAKSESLAIENEFTNNSAFLTVLFGTLTFREDYAVAMVKRKSNAANYDDFDKAGELLKNAYKIFSVNIADTGAYYPLLRNAVTIYTDIEKANEPRVRYDIVQSIIHHNISLAQAFLLNIDEALVYANKFSANKRAAQMPAQSLYRTIDFMKKRAVVKRGCPDKLLAKIAGA